MLRTKRKSLETYTQINNNRKIHLESKQKKSLGRKEKIVTIFQWE